MAFDPETVFAALQAELTAAGIWSGLDGLWINYGTASKRNLVSPGTYDLTEVGGPVLSSKGYTGDDIGAHVSSGYTPSGSGNYKLNNAGAGIFIYAQKNSGAGDTSDYVVGAASSDTLRIAGRYTTTGYARTRMNDAGTQDTFVIEPKGMIALRRSASGNYQIFKNGLLYRSITATSTALPGSPIMFLRTAAAYSPNTTTISAEWLGRSMTDAEMYTLYAAIGRALVSLGVITSDEAMFPQAATTWFNDPRSIKVGTNLIVGGVHGVDGTVVLNIIPADGVTPGRQLVLRERMELDDHDNPSILQRASDGRIMAFYCQHQANVYYMWVSTNAGEVESGGTETSLAAQLGHSGYSYANAFQLASGRIYLIYRAINATTTERAWHYSYSDNDGVTWTVGVQLTGPGRPYGRFTKNGSRIESIVNDGHPDQEALNGTYQYAIVDTAGVITFEDSAGNSMGSPPFDNTKWTRIYDAAVAGRSWTWGIDIIGGVKTAVFATFPTAVGIGTGTSVTASDHRYRQARWSGSAWAHEEVCAAGGPLYVDQPFYSGGICNDPENIDVVYCSRQVDSSGNVSTSGVFQIFKYTRTAPGVWTGQQLTFGSVFAFRPYIIPGTRKLQYLLGPYTNFGTFGTRIKVVDIS